MAVSAPTHTTPMGDLLALQSSGERSLGGSGGPIGGVWGARWGDPKGGIGGPKDGVWNMKWRDPILGYGGTKMGGPNVGIWGTKMGGPNVGLWGFQGWAVGVPGWDVGVPWVGCGGPRVGCGGPMGGLWGLAAPTGAAVRAVDVGRLAGGVLHTKLWVADGAHVYLGSANMDWRSLTQVGRDPKKPKSTPKNGPESPLTPNHTVSPLGGQ